MPNYTMQDTEGNSLELWALDVDRAEDEFFDLFNDYPLTIAEDGVDLG